MLSCKMQEFGEIGPKGRSEQAVCSGNVGFLPSDPLSVEIPVQIASSICLLHTDATTREQGRGYFTRSKMPGSREPCRA